MRIYDLEKPEVEPEILSEAPDRIRGVAYLQNDKLLLTSYIDKPGLGYAFSCDFLAAISDFFMKIEKPF